MDRAGDAGNVLRPLPNVLLAKGNVVATDQSSVDPKPVQIERGYYTPSTYHEIHVEATENGFVAFYAYDGGVTSKEANRGRRKCLGLGHTEAEAIGRLVINFNSRSR